jgi:hypothetical protein
MHSGNRNTLPHRQPQPRWPVPLDPLSHRQPQMTGGMRVSSVTTASSGDTSHQSAAGRSYSEEEVLLPWAEVAAVTSVGATLAARPEVEEDMAGRYHKAVEATEVPHQDEAVRMDGRPKDAKRDTREEDSSRLPPALAVAKLATRPQTAH